MTTTLARVAVTGASGLVGGNLARALAHDGHDVVCPGRDAGGLAHLDGVTLAFRHAELSNVDALAQAFAGVDVVYHCAALASMWSKQDALMWRTNVDGTQNVVDACRQVGVRRLVMCSTIDAIGIPAPGATADEDTPWNFEELGIRSGYARSKRAADALVRGSGLDAVFVHPAFVIGAYDAKPSSGRLLVEIARGRVVVSTGALKNFVPVQDVVAGLRAAAARGASGRSYIIGGENLRIADFCARAAALLGVSPPRFIAPRLAVRLAGALAPMVYWPTGKEPPLTPVIARMSTTDQPVSSARAVVELGHRHSSLDAALVEAVDWLKRHGALAR